MPISLPQSFQNKLIRDIWEEILAPNRNQLPGVTWILTGTRWLLRYSVSRHFPEGVSWHLRLCWDGAELSTSSRAGPKPQAPGPGTLEQTRVNYNGKVKNS